jgi:hypothetical protein
MGVRVDASWHDQLPSSIHHDCIMRNLHIASMMLHNLMQHYMRERLLCSDFINLMRLADGSDERKAVTQSPASKCDPTANMC